MPLLPPSLTRYQDDVMAEIKAAAAAEEAARKKVARASSHAIDLPRHFVYETHAVLQREKEAAAAAKEAKKKKKSK